MWKVVVAASFSLLCGVMLAEAQPDDSGNTWLPYCVQTQTLMEAWCRGVIDGLSFVSTYSCIPKGATNDQIKRVVVAYMNSKPDRLHYPFKVLAIEALSAAWPCTQQRSITSR